MPYYPKSQITTNLYAEPGELLVESNNTPYVGYYWTNSKGEYWSGKTPQDIPNVKLVTSFDPENNEIPPPVNSFNISIIVNTNPTYNFIKNISLGNPNNYQIIPPYSPVLPTQQDYQNGEFQRYFCKKTNEIQYIEINLDSYSKLVAKDPQIEYSLYQPFTITWILTGDKQQVAKTNKNIVDLAIKSLRLPKFNLYLKEDYTKYYQ
jgi:hypothetical protein